MNKHTLGLCLVVTAAVAADAARMDTPAMFLDGEPCPITDEAEPFAVLGMGKETNGWITITWESCPEYYYLVQTTTDMTASVWEVVAVVPGAEGRAHWTDPTTAGAQKRFYRVARLGSSGDYDGDGLSNSTERMLGSDPTNPDTDGDGLPDGWEAQYGLNPLADDADADLDRDGVNNLTEYLQGRDPTRGTVADTNGLVNLNVFTSLE